MTTVIELPYRPREQFLAFHNRKERFALMNCHRRAGKSVATINDLIIRALRTQKKNAKYAYVCPFYAQAKSIGWQYLTDATRDFAIEIRQSELSVELPNGSKIRLFGSDNIDALRGQYFDGVALDEYADMNPNLLGQVILPCLADRQGFLVILSTPKGKLNQFYDAYERAMESDDWFFSELKASTSNILPPEELQLMKSQAGEEAYDQEFEVSFTAALKGTYYSTQVADAEQQGRVDDKYDYDPNLPVEVSTDIGFTDSTVMWFFQRAPDGVRVIDCYENSNQPLAHYMQMLDARPYPISKLWLPHDAKAKSLQTGKSTVEQFLDAGFKCEITPNLKVQHGIDAVRATFPYIYFHTRCQHGIEALRVYRRQWDDKNKCFANTPLHDFSSDWADSFRYLCLVANVKAPVAVNDTTFKGIDPRQQGLHSLGELFKHNERGSNRRNNMRI